MVFSFVTGAVYNFTNIYHGFAGAKRKSAAAKALLPYLQLYLLIYLSSFSRFFQSSVLLFFAGLGLFQTYVAGLLNISSTA
jgi:hypothetical protein